MSGEPFSTPVMTIFINVTILDVRADGRTVGRADGRAGGRTVGRAHHFMVHVSFDFCDCFQFSWGSTGPGICPLALALVPYCQTFF